MRILLTTSLILTGALVMTQAASAAGAAKSKTDKEAKASILDHEMETLDGKKVNLAKKYKGKVVLLVNVASKCGFTPQYEGLEKLYEKYNSEGFTILGFPCNQFGSQEPGTNEEIQTFTHNWGVPFPVFAKVRLPACIHLLF